MATPPFPFQTHTEPGMPDEGDEDDEGDDRREHARQIYSTRPSGSDRRSSENT